MKKFFRTIHLYLGLAAGLVIMVICFTGAILVFEKELQQSFYPERYTVEKGEQKLPLSTTVESFEQSMKGSSVTAVKVYTDPERSLELTYSEKKKESADHGEEKKPRDMNGMGSEKKKPEAGKGAGGGSQAFINPYTGKLISLYTYRNTFFFTMFSLHRWLLAGDAGKMITGTSTFIFLFILITGMVLWWPKAKAKFKQHLTFKWGAGWKRINHDLHIVIGFYTAIFLFTSAFTGLAWSFEWFNNGIYRITGTENKRAEPPVSVFVEGATPVTFDRALETVQSLAPDAAYYTINRAKDANGSIAITVMSNDPVHEKASDQYFLDQYTGELIGTALYKDRNLGQRVRSTFYPVHVGSIGGVPGRIMVFLSCIAGVTFPVTGVIIWINRIKKRRKKKVKKESKKALLEPSVS